MNIYAIRHKPTGHFLPAAKRGATFYEPQRFDKLPGPRFFITKKGAQQALRAWLQGAWLVTHEQCGEFGEDTRTNLTPNAIPTRIRTDMEIVEYALKEISYERSAA